MELKQLSVLLVLLHVSVAAWQRVTVFKGQTVNLSCPLTNAHRTHVDWKNPGGFVMFFNRQQALKDKRYSIDKFSEFEFSISISNVTFKDGGNYTCSQYDHQTTERTVEVTVLGHPKMEMTKHDGQFAIKCSAEGNHHPPQIFWKLDQGPEMFAHTQVHHEGNKYESMNILRLQSVENRVTVKCLVRHPALHSQPLMDFMKIGRDSEYSSIISKYRHGKTGDESRLTTSISPAPVDPQRSSAPPPPPLQTTTTLPLDTGSHHSTTDDSTTSSESTESRNTSSSNTTSTTGRPFVSEETETTSFNSTERNTTGSVDVSDMQTAAEGSSSLLVFLVTCLIFGLLVIVIFFTIMLRRAHLAWKRENEDPDPSEESSKSKSSQEEKNAQGRRGLSQTAFTQYDVEQPKVIGTAWTPALERREEEEQPPRPLTPGQPAAACNIKETEL
ncbi:cytotoxic and regulatory T-cell molecule [Centropristis striata]|uniref:cytotoxic and regulatory T-cell molecule n=1 Tax=Centropristis striata TaxID=184440 RepID=UPI0027E191BB|nr:cytotoxic and regulatory T-cell molecule [Centropristis striata]